MIPEWRRNERQSKLVGRGKETNGVVRDRRAQRRAEILVVGQKLFEGDGIENGSRQRVRANLAALLDDGDGDGVELPGAWKLHSGCGLR